MAGLLPVLQAALEVLPAEEVCPEGQLLQAAAPRAEYWPRPQSGQEVALPPPPALPAAQAWHRPAE